MRRDTFPAVVSHLIAHHFSLHHVPVMPLYIRLSHHGM